MQFVPCAIPLAVTAAISAGPALYFRRRHPTAGTGWFALLMLAVSVWSSSYVLELSNDGLSGKLFWSKVEYLGVATIPTLWLAFALQYTGRERRLTRRNRLALSMLDDADNRIVDLNPAAQRIIGRQEKVIGQPELVVRDSAPRYGASL